MQFFLGVVGNASNRKKRFPCKDFGYNKNTVIRKSFLSKIVVHCCVVICCTLLYVVARSGSFVYTYKCTTKCQNIHDPLQNYYIGYGQNLI